MSDTVFIPLAATLAILEIADVKPGTTRQDDGDLSAIAIEPLYGWDPSPGSPTPLLDKMSERTLSVRFNWKERDLLDPKKAVDKNGTVTFLFVPHNSWRPRPADFFRDWRQLQHPAEQRLAIQAHAVRDGRRLVHSPRPVFQSSAGFPGQPSIKLGFEGGSEDDPLYRFGKEDGSHLEFGQFEIEFEWSTAVAGVRAVSRKSELVLNLDKSGDGFLSQILPGEKRIPLNLGLGWSTERGFFIDGGKGNVITQTNPPPPTPPPLTAAPRVSSLSRAPQAGEGDAANDADLNRVTPVGKTFGPVRIQSLSLGLTPESDNGKAALTFGVKVAADIKLGPVTASFDKAGFALTADFVKPDANLSLFDLDFGFQPPKAIGLDIDAKVVHGGGFLDLDREHANTQAHFTWRSRASPLSRRWAC